MDEDWSRATTAVEARLGELRMTRTGLAAAAGVNLKTVGNFLDRGMKPRADLRGGYENALGWQYGSLLAVARGGEPAIIAGARQDAALVGPADEDAEAFVADRGPEDRSPGISDDELLNEIRRVRAEVDERFDDLERRLRDRSVEGPS